MLAQLAVVSPKIQLAATALAANDDDSSFGFKNNIGDNLNAISSPSYRSVNRMVLKSEKERQIQVASSRRL